MNDHTISFNILIKKEKDLFVAHCLELDIVASSKLLDQVKTDIKHINNITNKRSDTFMPPPELFSPKASRIPPGLVNAIRTNQKI